MSSTLDKVTLLLAQAEGEGTTEAERATYMERAQRLATLAGIELAEARSRRLDKEKVEQPETRSGVRVNPWDRRRNRSHFVQLYLAIAQVNDVRCLIGNSEMYVFPTGFPSDIDVTNALFTTLSLQMVQEADASLKRGEHKSTYTDSWGDKRTYSATHGAVWRSNFYEGFIARVSSRLWEVKRSAERSVGADDLSTSTGLALRDKKAAVENFIEEDANWRRAGERAAKGSGWSPKESSEWSASAERAGMSAGARARLDNDDRSMAGGKARKEIGG